MMHLTDSRVVFDELTHTYTLDGVMLSGITPIVGWLFPGTYKDIPETVLARAAEYGTLVHKSIELSDTLGIATDVNAEAYIKMRTEHGCGIVRNEYLVTDGERYASSIDLVMDSPDGVVLGDIKTTSQLHRDNVRVQLSLYAYLFEMQTTIKVSKLVAVWLPKPQYGTPDWVEVERIPSDVCAGIMAAYYDGGDPTPWRNAIGLADVPVKVDATLPIDMEKAEREIVAIEAQLKELKAKSDALRDGLLKTFEECGRTESYDGELVRISYKAASTRETFDTAAFKKAHPDLYKEFLKYSSVKSSLIIKVK